MKTFEIAAGRIGVLCGLSLAFALAGTAPASAFGRFCTKTPNGSFEGANIACYSDKGCAFVKGIGADPIRGYDKRSVVAALGRGKIDGVYTSSQKIIDQVEDLGYICN